MNAKQKILWAICNVDRRWTDMYPLPFPCENVEEIYNELVEQDAHWDCKSEIRSSGIDTGLPTPYSRHYECEIVAMQFPDGSWVGWPYWHGGGKHSNPQDIEWIDDAFDLDCVEEEKVVIVRTFSKKGDE